jgi:hypothetical protein
MNKYTPGPWKFEKQNGWITNSETTSRNECVAFVASGVLSRMENGALIAAAPELLEALREMVLLFDDAREGCLLLQRADHKPMTNGDQQIIDKAFINAEAAIRKAKGETA